ncbi:cytochrome aa3 quinol oxidase subunit IV [Peribacillus sp. SIMBA_075]|uniref:cytochrome aa3 quinol oxidase subunit IV n=1 Tax=Peribacillus TaxID=2675229 RepID=UPI000B6B9A05|nr:MULTISPECIES: cytochrome aa3 quinol oxidase subunit IV [Peribacillus]MDV7763715.1 cytochrome aa3 quinol oxidase subunit IV [Peribacillus sp. CSMR9]MDW7616692.1 cytochrome aa3 quinol oxidase subunit IV [Peribacillus simplex]SNT43561.1 cytochrome aa3 quinol oxidase subunit 4 [Bacillus sp. OK838]
MKEFFPAKQVWGFVFSLILTVVALLVYFFNMSKATGMTIFILTAFIQAAVQLVVFMHARETDDSKSIFMTLYCAIFLALITVLGTILCMIWGWSY